MKALLLVAAALTGIIRGGIPQKGLRYTRPFDYRQPCENTPTSRGCWGQYDLNTDYYTTFPDTGDTVEIWLSAEEVPCNPDGYNRSCMTFNGTMPGPTIIANWGDNVVIHVTNNMNSNGTAIHWHGVRQLNSVEHDGVPGVTQCPIPPGETLTYKLRVTQYGTSWYHSHFSLQYAEGLFGPIIFNGPASSNYDIDLGVITLQDWSHLPIFAVWDAYQKWGIPHSFSNFLINGTNTFDCRSSSDSSCIGGSKKFQVVFHSGQKYRIRLVNVAVDSLFQFHIDGHKLRVIAADFVPLEPYDTDSIMISPGQRYDVVVDANAIPGNYWVRGGWVSACSGAANDHPEDMTGIVRYSSDSASNPITTSAVIKAKHCSDEPKERLIPHLRLDVGNITGATIEDVNFQFTRAGIFQWTINSSSLVLDWNNPTLKKIFDDAIFPSNYNVVSVDQISPVGDEWSVLVIENEDTGAFGSIAHPIHIHGHDIWILAQEANAVWDRTTKSFNLIQSPRRDVAMLPARGYLAVAFKLDNPGAWLVHCHVAWHASQGFALELVESVNSISFRSTDRSIFNETCLAWKNWSRHAPWSQDDSGI